MSVPFDSDTRIVVIIKAQFLDSCDNKLVLKSKHHAVVDKRTVMFGTGYLICVISELTYRYSLGKCQDNKTCLWEIFRVIEIPTLASDWGNSISQNQKILVNYWAAKSHKWENIGSFNSHTLVITGSAKPHKWENIGSFVPELG